MTARLADQILRALESEGTLTFREIAEAVLHVRHVTPAVAEKLVCAAIEGDPRFRVEAGCVAAKGSDRARDEAPMTLTMTSVLQVQTAGGTSCVGEVGLTVFTPRTVVEVESFVVAPRDGLARRALIEAGVGEDELREAEALESVRTRLRPLLRSIVIHANPSAARRVPELNRGDAMPLSRLAAAALGRGRWPLQRICSHLDIPLPTARRAAEEAAIAAGCAQVLIEMLTAAESDRPIDAARLRELVEVQPEAPQTDALISRAALSELPDAPGVYILRNAMGFCVYVGKSKNLKARVSSYWQRGGAETEKKQAIRKTVRSVDWELTGSELIALIREAELIEHYTPPINRQFEVHERQTPFSHRRSIAVVLPAAQVGFLDVAVVQRGGHVEICRIGRRGSMTAKLREAIRRCFHPETAAPREGERRTAQIASSWVERHRDEVGYVVVDEQPDPDSALKALQHLIEEVAERVHGLE